MYFNLSFNATALYVMNHDIAFLVILPDLTDSHVFLRGGESYASDLREMILLRCLQEPHATIYQVFHAYLSTHWISQDSLIGVDIVPKKGYTVLDVYPCRLALCRYSK